MAFAPLQDGSAAASTTNNPSELEALTAIAALAAMPIGAVAQDDLYIETMEVNVISLDVFVTDKKGNPVTGLTVDDFIVYENGRPQDITNFSEIRETPQLVTVPTISPRPMALSSWR